MAHPATHIPKVAFIADDDAEDIEMLCETIRDIDTHIHTQLFRNGKDVLSKLLACRDQELPDILILDYSMPGCTAFQVLKAIANQSRYDGIAKYILSTSGALKYKEECLKTGATAYFVKPDSMTELRSIARKMLEKEAK